MNASDISGPQSRYSAVRLLDISVRYARVDPCTCAPTLVLSRSPLERTFGQGKADANRQTLAKDAACVGIDGAAFGEWIHVLLALCQRYSSGARPAAVPAKLRNLVEPFGWFVAICLCLKFY